MDVSHVKIVRKKELVPDAQWMVMMKIIVQPVLKEQLNVGIARNRMKIVQDVFKAVLRNVSARKVAELVSNA